MLPEINLLPKYERQNPVEYMIFLAALILFALLLSLQVFFHFYTQSALKKTDVKIVELTDEKNLLVAEKTRRDNEVLSYNKAFEFVEQRVMPTSVVMDEVVNLLPENGYLNKFDYNYQTVDIDIQFASLSEVATYLDLLQTSIFVKDIQVNQIDADAEATYAVSYSVDIDQIVVKGEGQDEQAE